MDSESLLSKWGCMENLFISSNRSEGKEINRLFQTNALFIVRNKQEDLEVVQKTLDTSVQSDKSIVDNSVVEDLDGDPLLIAEIADLQTSLPAEEKDSDLDQEQNKTSAIFDFSGVEPLEWHKFKKLFLSHHKSCLGKSKCCDFFALVDREDCSVFGVIHTSSPSVYRILQKRSQPDDCLESRVVDLKQSLMKRFQNVVTSVEAVYPLQSALFAVGWDNALSVLDLPPKGAKGHLKISINSEDFGNSTGFLNEDLETLKLINSAVEEDAFIWTNSFSEVEDVTLDEFKTNLSLVFSEFSNGDLKSEKSFRNIVDNREKDFTEILWDLLKNVRSKKVFKKCIEASLEFLKERKEPTLISNDNPGEFANRIRTFLTDKQYYLISLFGNLENLVEIGLYKLTLDFITILKTEFPDISEDVLNPFLKTRSGSSSNRFAHLDHLYRVCSFSAILMNNIRPQPLLKLVREMLMSFHVNKPSIISDTKTFTVCVQDFNKSLSDPSKWILKMESHSPIFSSKRVIYERVPFEGGFSYIRHDFQLIETRLFF